MKYLFIAQHKKTWPVDLMCRLLGVTRSGYYGYQRRGSDGIDYYHQELLEAVRDIAKATWDSYGSRRMKKALNALNYPVSRNKARKLMKEAGVQVKHRKKYKVTTNSNHKQPVFDNVVDRKFDIDQPDQVYVGDITYLWTQEGWLYLAVVIDLYSRKVVGWSMGSRMTAQLVCDALTMALFRRHFPRETIIHSDRGSQYCSKRYQRLISNNGLRCSMGRRANCYDNAAMESFFHTLKVELVHRERYTTRRMAKSKIFEYIETYYNRQRKHSAIGHRIPMLFEKAA